MQVRMNQAQVAQQFYGVGKMGRLKTRCFLIVLIILHPLVSYPSSKKEDIGLAMQWGTHLGHNSYELDLGNFKKCDKIYL